MCLRSHWSQVGFQGGLLAPRSIPLPIPLVVQIGSFSSWYSFTLRVWCCLSFCSCFQGSTTMCTSTAVSDFLVTWWEMQALNFKWLEGAGKSLHLTVLLVEGSSACPLQNLLSVSCSGLASHPFPSGCLTVGGRYEFSSLWLITWPVFFQLLLACAALIMGLFLAAAGETAADTGSFYFSRFTITIPFSLRVFQKSTQLFLKSLLWMSVCWALGNTVQKRERGYLWRGGDKHQNS